MMKKCFLCGALLFSVLVSGCYIAEDSSKKNITIETNASSGDKVWFMAVSMDSADIPASSVPYFHISRAKSVEAENIRPEKNNDSSNEFNNSRNFNTSSEYISKSNTALLKSLSSRNLYNYSYKEKLFNPKGSKGRTTKIKLNTDSSILKEEKATKMYSGKYCNVFFVQNGNCPITKEQLSSYKLNGRTVDLFEVFGKLFDDKIFPNITDILGAYEYTTTYENVISCPKKINIVISDLFYDYSNTSKTKSGTYGYFWAGDMFKDYENQDSIIHLDSFFILENPESVYSTLAHEFNHMLNTINKSFVHKKEFSTWYTEMLSALADAMFENYLSENLKDDDSIVNSRIPFFNTWYNLGFSTWRSGTTDYFPSGDVLISYGNVFAFGNFIAKNYGGFKLIKEIAENKYVDEESIVQAVRKYNPERSGITFKDILKDFSCVQITNYTSNGSFPTLRKEVTYEKNKSICLKSIDKDNSKYRKNYNHNKTSGLYAISKNTPVVLGQYGFLLYGYSVGGGSVTATIDKNYNAFAYTVLDKQK